MHVVRMESAFQLVPFKEGKYLTVGSFHKTPSSTERSITLLADAMSFLSFDFLVLGENFNLPDMAR